MSRHSRRGMVDLVVMIVMIVVLLGMGTLAFLTYDKAQKEKQYLSALREIPARQEAELDAVKARYAEVCMYIGFKGDAAYSSPKAINALLERGADVVADYYELPSGDSPLSGTKDGTISVTVRDPKTGEPKKINIPIHTINKTTRNAAHIYEKADIQTLQAALGRQDEVINGLVMTHIPRLVAQRELQKKQKADEADKKTSETDKGYADIKTKIGNADTDIQKSQADVAAAEQDLANKMNQENQAYLQLDSTETRSARENAFAAAREAAVARKQARDAMEAFRLQADKRRLDDSKDPDGAIFLVDKKSGYCWINIGQKSDVRKNLTFQVLRADASRDSDIQIGEIRVQEVLRGNIARCRVDALDDPKVYPEAGDIIKNPNYSAREYRSWSLAGEFGGKYTKYTRRQLTDLLRSLGYEVTDKITLTTDAVIIGGNWRDDPQFANALKQRTNNFETYSEEEVLWFLGRTGPDQQD